MRVFRSLGHWSVCSRGYTSFERNGLRAFIGWWERLWYRPVFVPWSSRYPTFHCWGYDEWMIPLWWARALWCVMSVMCCVWGVVLWCCGYGRFEWVSCLSICFPVVEFKAREGCVVEEDSTKRVLNNWIYISYQGTDPRSFPIFSTASVCGPSLGHVHLSCVNEMEWVVLFVEV